MGTGLCSPFVLFPDTAGTSFVLAVLCFPFAIALYSPSQHSINITTSLTLVCTNTSDTATSQTSDKRNLNTIRHFKHRRDTHSSDVTEAASSTQERPYHGFLSTKGALLHQNTILWH